MSPEMFGECLPSNIALQEYVDERETPIHFKFQIINRLNTALAIGYLNSYLENKDTKYSEHWTILQIIYKFPSKIKKKNKKTG